MGVPSRHLSHVRRLADLDELEVLHTRLERHRFPEHFHDTFVVQWVHGGSDHCPTSGLTAHRDELFVHGPGVTHGGVSGDRDPLEYQACYPSRRLVADLLGLEVDGGPPVGTLVLRGEGVRRASRRLFSTLSSRRDTAAQRAALRGLMEQALDAAQQAAPEAATPDLTEAMGRAREHLVGHLHRDVRIRELSEVCGLSPSHLIRVFKRALGITPRQFVISQRVAAARRMLVGGQAIAEVAHALGYADQSHLTRQFKRLTTLSPGQLQRS